MVKDTDQAAAKVDHDTTAPDEANDAVEYLSADDQKYLRSLQNSNFLITWRKVVLNDPGKLRVFLDDIQSRAPEMALWIAQHRKVFLDMFCEIPSDDANNDGSDTTSRSSMEEHRSSNTVSTRLLSLEGSVTESDSFMLSCQTSPHQVSAPSDGADDVGSLAYSAISYAWGDKKDRQRILCDGKMVEIPKSLYGALLKLWSFQPELLLWADALSIDQTDIEDKLRQVSQMALIFGSAQKVHVWTGQKNSYVDAFWPWLQIFEHDDWFDRLITSATNYVETREHGNPQVAGQNQWDFMNDDFLLGMKDLLSRKWFTRAWTYQEVINARTWIFHCGNLHIDGRAVEKTLDVCANKLVSQLIAVPQSKKWVNALCLQIWYVWDTEAKKNYGQFLYRSASRDLLSDLINIRHRDSSDPCDKVNAVIGLHSGLPIRPAYQDTPVWLFARAAKVCIEECMSLNLLSYRKLTPDLETLEHLPSWAIDWRKPSMRWADNQKAYDLFAAHPCQLVDKDYEWGQSQYLSTLTLRGIVCGIIREKPDEPNETRYWLEEMPNLTATDGSLSSYLDSQVLLNHRLLDPENRTTDTSSSCPDKWYGLQLFYQKEKEEVRRKTEPMHCLMLAKSGDYLCMLYGAPGFVILRPQKDWLKIHNHTKGLDWELFAIATQNVQPFSFVSLVEHPCSKQYRDTKWGNAPLSVPNLRVDSSHVRLSTEKVKDLGDTAAEAELDQLVALLTSLSVVPATFVII